LSPVSGRVRAGHLRRWPLVACAFGSVLSLALISGLTSAASTVIVTINDTSLAPASVTTSLGNSIDWQNATSVAQVVTIGSTILPAIQPGAMSILWKPTATGTYPYTVRRQVPPKTALHGTIEIGPGPTPTRSPSPSVRPSPTATARTTIPSEPNDTGIIVELTAPPSASDFSASPEPSESGSFEAPILAGSVSPASAAGPSAPAASGGLTGLVVPIVLMIIAALVGVYAYRRSTAASSIASRSIGQAHPNSPRWDAEPPNSAPSRSNSTPPGWVPVSSLPADEVGPPAGPPTAWDPDSEPLASDRDDEDTQLR
jgi:hypothetical protein